MQKQACLLGDPRKFVPEQENKDQTSPYLHIIPLKPKGMAYSCQAMARYSNGDTPKSAR